MKIIGRTASNRGAFMAALSFALASGVGWIGPRHRPHKRLMRRRFGPSSCTLSILYKYGSESIESLQSESTSASLASSGRDGVYGLPREDWCTTLALHSIIDTTSPRCQPPLPLLSLPIRMCAQSAWTGVETEPPTTAMLMMKLLHHLLLRPPIRAKQW